MHLALISLVPVALSVGRICASALPDDGPHAVVSNGETSKHNHIAAAGRDVEPLFSTSLDEYLDTLLKLLEKDEHGDSSSGINPTIPSSVQPNRDVTDGDKSAPKGLLQQTGISLQPKESKARGGPATNDSLSNTRAIPPLQAIEKSARSGPARARL